MKTAIALFSLILLSTACIKTAEQVNREKKLDSISEQVKDSQGLVAEMASMLRDMQGQLDRQTGKIEELEHKVAGSDLKQMSETLNLIKTQNEALTNENNQLKEQMGSLQNEMKEQRDFIEKVTKSLGTMKSSSTSSQKKSAKTDLEKALNLIKDDKYKEARSLLEPIIDHEDLTPGEKNKVMHSLGKVEFYTKNYDQSLVYFSKVYTKYPKSSLAPNALLFIGRSLKSLNKKSEAKEAFEQVKENYAGTADAKLADSEIKKL